jgi:hypothetical protein
MAKARFSTRQLVTVLSKLAEETIRNGVAVPKPEMCSSDGTAGLLVHGKCKLLQSSHASIEAYGKSKALTPVTVAQHDGERTSSITAFGLHLWSPPRV